MNLVNLDIRFIICYFFLDGLQIFYIYMFGLNFDIITTNREAIPKGKAEELGL